MTEYRSRFGNNKSATTPPPVKQAPSGQMLNDEARKLLEEKSRAAAKASLQAAEAGARKTVEAGKAALDKFKGWRSGKAEASITADAVAEVPAEVESSPHEATTKVVREGYDTTFAAPMSFSVAMVGEDDRDGVDGPEVEGELPREAGLLVIDGMGSLPVELACGLDIVITPSEVDPLTDADYESIAAALNAESVKSATAEFIELGEASGRLTQKYLPNAPDEVVVMGLAGDDLFKHCLEFGETGSGMTSSTHAPRANERLAVERKKDGDLQQKKRWMLVAAGLVAVAFLVLTSIYWTSGDGDEPPATQRPAVTPTVLAPVAPAPVVMDIQLGPADPAPVAPQEDPQPAVDTPNEVAVPKVEQVAPVPVESPAAVSQPTPKQKAASAAAKPMQAKKPAPEPAAIQPASDSEQEAIDAIRDFEKKLGGG